MASPAPWLRWTQTELTRWHGAEEEEEEEEDDFERRMDEDGVIGLGEAARSPPWGDSEDLEEGSPADEGRWHPRQDLAQEDEERGSSGEDEGPWGAESDGEPYPELSSEGRWGSGSSGSREVLRDGRALCQPRGCSTDGGDISGLSDTSPGPATPSRQHRGWGTAGDTIGGHRQEWTPRRSLPLQLSTDDPSPEPVPEPQTAGTGLPAPSTAGLAPTEEPRDTGNPPAAQGHDRSRVPKKAAPAVVPPKPARQSRSLSPRRRAGGKGTRDPSGTGTESTQYGRGRLNHPLPDLSKVEARVKFDQSYRPPRGRVLPARPRGPGGPIGFKSPAEIVREVLLSNGEGVPSQPPSTAALRQEFGSPRQATALVQQLQDDYHKLLTKYAEAENTIDQLRLGARVSLFSDPPQPSRSLAVGTVATGCRVMTLNIPQARTAALGMATAPATAPAPPGAAAASGPSERGGSPQPRSPPPPGGGCPACPGPCCCPGPRLTRALAGQSRRLQAQVESFESWMRAGTPTPSEQLQRMRMLKDAQDALEREYLRGRQQLPGAAEGFDPDRVVEGEIYRLGLRLEGLKERLEPGGRRQPLPQPPPQPRCPPAPSPPPVVHSPRPEVSWGCKGSPPHCSCGGCLSQPLLLCPAEPCLVESPRGTAGDSEGVAGGLPWPLWHKQRQVEEDFGDLLEQYQHFKSLPESLSLEQLSLAESGSQEEVDAATAGDGGPSKVPCRTRSLEEGANIQTLPLPLPERRAATLPPRGPPNLGDTQGHPSPATAEEPPASAKPPLGVPGPPRVPLSRRSSGTGSAATQHGPRKEQRIVSPETDSGFVGSEASRVSPPVHTPEHHPAGTGTPGSLGPSIPIPTTLLTPRKREMTPLPSETALMGIYPPGGTGGPRLPPSSPSQSSSPPRWAESSEAGPDADGDGTHTDSEVGDRSCASAGDHPAAMARSPTSPLPSPQTPSPTLLSPDPPSLDPAPCDLLGSRLERDQAIRALQDEVWRLRRRLEESLRRSCSYPEGKATPRGTPARRPPVASGPSSPQDAAPSGDPSPPVRGRVAPGVTPTWRERSASLPRHRPELDLGLEDPSGSRPASLSSAAASGSEPSPAGPRAPPSLRRHRGNPPGAVTFRGQCTGTRYQAGTPRATPAPREEPGTSGCPRCHRGRMASAGFGGGDATWQPQHSTPRRTSCPTCRPPMGAPGSRDRAASAERGPGGTCPPGPRVGAEKPEQRGLWYLAATPAATAATVCLAPVPLVPYVPSMLYCSPTVPTSAPALAGVPLGVLAGPRRAESPPRPQGHHRCLSLDLEELEELNWSLSRAVEAAQSVRLTTTRMSRALAAELGRARGLRGSCLF
ncbi:LOW QUALITY PROTEIN: microtubule organization protein AKNA [Corvus moneduloides]|uniref:LOW QUALITY PROTEIN: microtubule organization protein AKNA n=1 Tax=Corvus moneduloides TaxID=1196302 RepID=UPI001362C5F0|nr:LOW QUALITY PROTEIN: microtubule organization protein AKNA [Corvus moneduloides]